MRWVLEKDLDNIQNWFDARKNLNTPHISTIKDIQNILIDNLNKHADSKTITIKVESEDITEIKKLLKSISIDRKTKQEKQSIALKGLSAKRKKRKPSLKKSRKVA